jgi:hypothetical protein
MKNLTLEKAKGLSIKKWNYFKELLEKDKTEDIGSLYSKLRRKYTGLKRLEADCGLCHMLKNRKN